MGIWGSSPAAMCSVEESCAEWAAEYMKYCLCSTKDWVSFIFGLISLMSWAVAEIPQIITNYKQKSAEGLSLAFLITWVVGDLLNLFGCILEPATLPTQYYIAVLYTFTTLIVAGQTIYYGYIYYRLKPYKRSHEVIQIEVEKARRGYSGPDNKEDDHVESRGKRIKSYVSMITPSSPIPLPAFPRDHSTTEDLYFVSARSLSLSHTPTMGSFPVRRNSTSDAEQYPIEEPLLHAVISPKSAPPNLKTMLCVVSFLTFFLGSLNLQNSESTGYMLILQNQAGEFVKQAGRRLLQASEVARKTTSSLEDSSIGTFLGWGMAFAYMGGRLPQICLNIRRRNVEGLNPLMFLFALVGNTTYVASFVLLCLSSILVISMAWSKVRPNLPWLVDAGGCVLLDIFILIQFIYFRYWAPRGVKQIGAGT